MDRIIISAVLVAGLLLAASTGAQAALIQITANDQGHYSDAGTHVTGNVNYIVGEISTGTVFRNWFVFNTISTVGMAINNATLRIYNVDSPPSFSPGYLSTDLTETYSLFDVSTDIGTLTGGTGGVAAFNDLGSGVGYGSYIASAADNGTFIEIILNSAAISALNAANGDIALGGALTTLGSIGEEHLFSFSQDNPSVELVVSTSTIPIPAALWLFGSGLVGLIGIARKKVISS